MELDPEPSAIEKISVQEKEIGKQTLLFLSGVLVANLAMLFSTG